MKIDVPPIVANAFVSWRTTLAGVLAFVVFNGPQLQAYFQQNQALDQSRFWFGLLVMVAMIIARDGTVSSEKAGAIQPPILKPFNSDSNTGLPPIPVIVFALMCLGVLSGCATTRDKRLVEAHEKMVERYEADHANLKAVAVTTDAALAQAQRNDFQYRLDQRISQIAQVVAQRPDMAGQGIAAVATANAEFNALVEQQAAAQAAFQSIVAQSESTNIAQARQLDASIRKYDNTAPFNATAAVTSVANTIAPLIPKTRVTTISAAPLIPPKPAASMLPDATK